MEKQNSVFLRGQVARFGGERGPFSKLVLKIERRSCNLDNVPVEVVHEKAEGIEVGSYIEVQGKLSSYNEDGHLRIVVIADDITILDGPCDEYEDIVAFTGYVCRQPTYRTTPFGREITDLFLAVGTRHPSYIPCITWGNKARLARELKIGTNISVRGRYQSRIYEKTLPNGDIEKRIAYEISVHDITVLQK